MPFAGRFAEILFAIGLLGASLLAAAILPGRRPRTSWPRRSASRRASAAGRDEAPVFVGVITALIAIGTVGRGDPGRAR